MRDGELAKVSSVLETLADQQLKCADNNTMKLLAIPNLPRLNTTPLASVRLENGGVIVNVDDEQEQRVQIVMRPYQAMRMTTADCFMFSSGTNIIPKTICEVLESEWISDLKRILSVTDETATFLNRAHHYLFPLQDDFLEVVAWDIAVSVR